MKVQEGPQLMKEYLRLSDEYEVLAYSYANILREILDYEERLDKRWWWFTLRLNVSVNLLRILKRNHTKVVNSRKR